MFISVVMQLFFRFAMLKSQIAINYILAEGGFSNIQKTLVYNKSSVNSMFQVIAMQFIRMFLISYIPQCQFAL